MARRQPPFLAVGRVDKPHGTRGELYVRPLSDRADKRFAPGIRLRVANAAGDGPDEAFSPLQVERARPFKDGHLVRFASYRDRNAAEALRDRYLLVASEDLAPLERGEHYYHELMGLAVITSAGDRIGEVTDIHDIAASQLLEVKGPERTHLIPIVGAFIKAVDIEEGRIIVEVPPGFLDI